jgi:hypothetical protein
MNARVKPDEMTPANPPADAPGTALTLANRAAVALGSPAYETRLAALVANSVAIVAIASPDAYKECHTARVALKNTRLAIGVAAKVARDDATKFSKAVIEEEKRLVALVQPEETRLQTLQDDYEAALEAEKERLRDIETNRLAAIKARISVFQSAPLSMVGKTSTDIAAHCDTLQDLVIDAENYAEHAALAQQIKEATIKTLCELHATVLAQEVEAERQAQERANLLAQLKQVEAAAAAARADAKAQADKDRAELAVLRAEQAKRDAETAKAARKQKEINDAPARAELERRARVERERIAEQTQREAEINALHTSINSLTEPLDKNQLIDVLNLIQSYLLEKAA